MAAQEVAHFVPGFPQTLRLAGRGASCWREGSPAYEGTPTNGPYIVTEDGGKWNVWSNDGVAAVEDDEEAAVRRMAELADAWREMMVRKVYFIGTGLELGDPVKIGVAYKPKQRLGALQVGFPYELRLLAVMEGGERVEARLHRMYSAARLRGEWFAMTRSLRRLIERLSNANR